MDTHSQIKLQVRRAIYSDAFNLWSIRNHPLVRKFSFNKKIIKFTDHKKWLEQFLKQNNNLLYILEKRSLPGHEWNSIGYCRYDFLANKYLVSIAIHPDDWNKGFATYLLRKTLKPVRFSGKTIYAEVMPDNKTSLQLFLKNKFAQDSCLNDRIVLKFLASK